MKQFVLKDVKVIKNQTLTNEIVFHPAFLQEFFTASA